jgi:hypothetical protein
MPRSTRLLTGAAVLACFAGGFVPWLLTSAGAADGDNFAGTAAVTISNHGGVTAKPLNGFDISFADPVIGLYALGDRTNNAVDLVDTHSNTFLSFCGHGQFAGATGNNNTSGPDGVLIRDHREVWAGDGNSTVKVFDIAGCDESAVPTHVIVTGTPADNRADEMCYDPRDNLIMVANNAASPPFASLISTTSYTVVKKIPFTQSTNGAEQCQWSPRTGKFYITVPGIETPDNGHGQVVVINPKTLAVETTFDIPLANCNTPQGMAVGPDHDILVGCNGNGTATHSSVIIDERNGKILATVANESGPDEVWYNPGNNHYFLARSGAANGGQVEQALGVIDAETRVADTGILNVGPVNNPPTSPHPSAHSVAADAVTNETFFPIPGGLSTLCGAAGGNDASGCILVVTGKNDKDDCVAEGAPVKEANAGEDVVFLKGRCRDNDRHHDSD